jgi:hypothetical protein
VPLPSPERLQLTYPYTNSGIRTTCQWNTKIFYPKSENKPILWSSDPLTGLDISEDKLNFYADNCAIELSEDGNSYAVKSLTNEKSIVNVNVTRVAPGFQVGTDGYTHFGTDPKAPWGSMRHAFWPRCTCEGTIVTADGPIDFKGKAMFIHALQGMKPHHLAARWNFANFQGPEYTAVMMEFTTPPSYGSTIVNVGGIIKGNEILYAGATNSAKHTKFKEDPENAWPEPEAARFEWKGTTKDGKAIEAVLEGPLETRLDRIDIMAEVPYFVKKIIANAAGTKPYIYQVCHRPHFCRSYHPHPHSPLPFPLPSSPSLQEYAISSHLISSI